jgi:hypothetical protein
MLKPTTTTKKKPWLIFIARKFFDFIDAELKNQVIGLQLATEIELYPVISFITRYWNIKLGNDNKAWIPRLIVAA